MLPFRPLNNFIEDAGNYNPEAIYYFQISTMQVGPRLFALRPCDREVIDLLRDPTVQVCSLPTGRTLYFAIPFPEEALTWLDHAELLELGRHLDDNINLLVQIAGPAAFEHCLSVMYLIADRIEHVWDYPAVLPTSVATDVGEFLHFLKSLTPEEHELLHTGHAIITLGGPDNGYRLEPPTEREHEHVRIAMRNYNAERVPLCDTCFGKLQHGSRRPNREGLKKDCSKSTLVSTDGRGQLIQLDQFKAFLQALANFEADYNQRGYIPQVPEHFLGYRLGALLFPEIQVRPQEWRMFHETGELPRDVEAWARTLTENQLKQLHNDLVYYGRLEVRDFMHAMQCAPIPEGIEQGLSEISADQRREASLNAFFQTLTDFELDLVQKGMKDVVPDDSELGWRLAERSKTGDGSRGQEIHRIGADSTTTDQQKVPEEHSGKKAVSQSIPERTEQAAHRSSARGVSMNDYLQTLTDFELDCFMQGLLGIAADESELGWRLVGPKQKGSFMQGPQSAVSSGRPEKKPTTKASWSNVEALYKELESLSLDEKLMNREYCELAAQPAVPRRMEAASGENSPSQPSRNNHSQQSRQSIQDSRRTARSDIERLSSTEARRSHSRHNDWVYVGEDQPSSSPSSPSRDRQG
ncbi:hypothetical protein BU26DRAFT_521491 [Trematosphaeria pertusa]|uniref:Uncharacterized protein n=1 Tax=Trematosphaeria pertusa TaxID=390896 RepID=A0A6A6I7C0_9PLEO|nr:uncharacterized protein BU26DRAFT_521491 [Trematosphaeria pertusa]KAF2245968.1 hypothetical protein BU26DRAFT_521491 [Trematosphaeria pertusa]